MPYIVRPNGRADLAGATIHGETGLPQIIDVAAGDYDVGRVEWCPTPVVVPASKAAGAPAISSSTVTPAAGTNGTTFRSDYTGSGEDTATRQWYANGTAIAGATGATYVATLGDLGLITCDVTLANSAGSVSLESSPSSVDLDPAALLAGATTAMWFDPSDGSGFFSDTGTTQATPGQAVRQWNDKSGIGSLVASQGTPGARPTLVAESDGRVALQFDGVDDEMVLSSQVVAGGVVVGATPSAGDANYNDPTPLGSAAGRYITIGPGATYRYRATSTTTSAMPADNPGAQVGSFNAFAPDAVTPGDMNAYQDGAAARDNPESKGLIVDLDLLGRRGGSTRFAGRCYGVIARDTPFTDQERTALQEWMGRRTWPIASGEEYHAAGGFPLRTYVYQGA